MEGEEEDWEDEGDMEAELQLLAPRDPRPSRRLVRPRTGDIPPSLWCQSAE